MPVRVSEAAALPPSLPLASPGEGRLLALGAHLLAAIGAAPSLDDGLRDAALLLQQGVAGLVVHPFRVSGVTRTHIVIAVLSGAGASRTVPEDLPLDEALGAALMSGRNHAEPNGATLHIAVRRDGQPVAGLALTGAAGAFDAAPPASLFEIVRLALNQSAQREPVQHAALGLPALSREFAEVLDDNLFISNPERDHFDFLTGSTLDIWGISREQFALHPASLVERVIEEDRPLLAQRRQRERACEPCDVSFRIRHPAKGLRWLRSRTRTLLAPDGAPRVYGIVSDVTVERQRAAELERALDAAEAASRAKSQFMANMSHEIRTPMNGILGMTELLLGTTLSGEQRRFAQAVYDSGESLLEIINDILDFSKIEAGKLELAPTDFTLRAVVEDTLELLAPRAHAKGLEISLLGHPGLPTQLHGDALRLRQVLTNLVANAIKFTEHGEIVIEMAAAREGASGQSLPIEFRVRDTGIGMERDALARLFSAFTQGHDGTRKRYGGTGLGLVIVRRLVELMGGTIDVQSAPGIGSEFTVRLPFRAAQAGGHGGETDTTELAGLRALVVDDNATNRQVLDTLLCGWDIAVTLAVDGQAALELLQSGAAAPFDFALVDMHMPRLDGLQLATALREGGVAAGTKLIMLSSASSADDARAAREAGYQRFVAKPVRKAELYRAIQGVVASARASVEAVTAMNCDVLVVEDNVVNRQVFDQMLKSLGCRAQLASGAMEGLRALCEKRFDLVLMDIQMPGMDGIEALRAFRRGPGSRFAFVSPPDTPVIAVTANALPDDESRLRSLGFDDYLSKPFRRSQLLAMLNHRLNLAAPADPAADPPTPAARAEVAAGAQAKEVRVDVLDAGALDRLRELDPKGENQLLQRVLTAFQTSTARLVPQVRAACTAGDLNGVRHVAHTLKSSSASIGALRLAQLCSELESMIRLGKPESLPERVEAMCAEVETVLQALRHLLDGTP